MDIPPSVNAMLNGNVDAALVAGSDVLRAQKAGAHIIISGKGLVDATIVIAARGDLVKTILIFLNVIFQLIVKILTI